MTLADTNKNNFYPWDFQKHEIEELIKSLMRLSLRVV